VARLVADRHRARRTEINCALLDDEQTRRRNGPTVDIHRETTKGEAGIGVSLMLSQYDEFRFGLLQATNGRLRVVSLQKRLDVLIVEHRSLHRPSSANRDGLDGCERTRSGLGVLDDGTSLVSVSES
jgi:hypothetical protein